MECVQLEFNSKWPARRLVGYLVNHQFVLYSSVALTLLASST